MKTKNRNALGILICLIILFSPIHIYSEKEFVESDILKFKHLDKWKVNKDKRVSVFQHYNGFSVGAWIKGKKLKLSGSYETSFDEKTNTAFWEDYTNIYEITIQNKKVKLEHLKTRKQTEKDKKLADINLGGNTYFTHEIENYPRFVDQFIPPNLKVIDVMTADINNDMEMDFVVVFSYPTEFIKPSVDSKSKLIVETVNIAIILSQGKQHYLQYLDFLTLSSSGCFIDMKLVNPLRKKNKQIFVRSMSESKRGPAGEFNLYIID